MKRIHTILIFLALNTVLVFAATPKTITGATAGTLSSKLTAAEKTTVTDLTVSGTMNAVDFKFMRDEMTALAVIDLTNVTISIYTGTGGTYDASPRTYPANEMPGKAFAGTSTRGKDITSIKLPTTLTTFGDFVFYSCNALTSINTLPAGITTIGEGAFYGCGLLAGSISLPKVVTIKKNAFNSCSNLSGSLILPNTLTTVGDGAFQGCNGFTGDLTIPNSVTSIGINAFQGCQGLKGTLTLSNALTLIPDYAFENCRFTGSLVIPNSVTKIGKQAFYNSYQQSTVGSPSVLTLGSNLDYIDVEAFRNCGRFKGNLVIPNTTRIIGVSAFQNCNGFDGSLTLGSNVTGIGQNSFYQCANLTGSLVIPDKVEYIETGAFGSCFKLFGKLTLGSGILYINGGVFTDSKFTSIHSKSSTPPTLYNGLPFVKIIITEAGTDTTKLFVPDASLNAYKTALNWSELKIISDVYMTTSTGNTQENNVKIYTNADKIIIENLAISETATVYNMSGIEVKKASSDGNEVSIQVPKGAVYIVKAGHLRQKIVL